ncbi:hypothetical protein PGT21_007119 [Puccinia graminis f. sp. tritici]|uniref:Amino acid permease/ SLC12A domain-containing protein n=1 Tax=Puccinia graminis f. sp. tritici TaxID=56615 RepID=A0A5B0MUL7_PUCGR|nr:hypothetical protein PGTUg99_027922 [Puccinia graminis f. sp. tritici]KAA1104002.1 hypothetical protein PGT21_007119 [Puccinia graminis f. sp. tritici]
MTMIARPLQYDPEPHKDNPRSRENLAVNVDILPFEEKKVDDGMSTNGSADASAQVQRKLKQRHISMIAVAGTIGTGLFLGSGQSLRQAGPIGTLLGYILMGAVVFSMQVALGEMVTMFPVTGAIPHYAERFFDPAMGFAVGVNMCFGNIISLAAEITAAAILVEYWDATTPSWVYITIFLVTICAINLTGVRWYGEAEFIFSAIKLSVILILIILGIVLDLGGGPTHDRIGFRYWLDPGPFSQLHGILGPVGRFLGFWTVFIQAAYSYLGVEAVAIIAGEAENPRKTIPKAIKRVFFRILIFYIGGVTVAGLLVPSNSPRLASVRGHGTAQASPFVIAINNGGISVLPDIVNAVILLSAYSTGNTALYCGSRILHGLACRNMAPSFFKRCTKSGLPIFALIPTATGGLLAFLRLNHSGATVFHWLTRMSAVTGLCTWLSVLVSYLQFYRGMKYHGICRNKIPYKSPFQPYLTYFGLLMVILVIFFSGFEVFLKDNWSTSNFVTNYITLVIYILLFIYWKVTKRGKLVRIQEMDLIAGTKHFELMDAHYQENIKIPRTRLQKLWDWLL